jgi:integrase
MYGDGTIWYDSKRKKYCYDYYDNDGKRHRKRFATEKEAKEFKKEIRAERDRGNLTATTITIGEWVIEFLETYQKPHLRSSSFARQKQSANKLAPIAHIPIDQLNGKEIQMLYNSYDGILSTSSISKIHKLLFAAYKKAVALRMVQYNPMQAADN